MMAYNYHHYITEIHQEIHKKNTNKYAEQTIKIKAQMFSSIALPES